MAATHNQSLSDLERQAEATRSELAQTVDALTNRVSPDALKADVRNYARDTGQHMLDTIENRFRENPLQAVAVAAGLAYPLWRMLGRMPAPLLLIGAGLAISSRKGRSHSTRYEDEYERGGSGGLKAAAADTVTDIKEKASDLGSQAAARTHDAVEAVRNAASDTVARASSVLSETYESGRERAANVSDQVTEGYARAVDNARDVVERHPVLVGGIAFAVGSLVASAVPLSRQENRVLGESSDELKRRTKDVAAEGLDHAKTAAQEIYDSASTEFGEDGLTPDSARRTARAAVDTAREAVEAVTSQSPASQTR